MHTDTMHTGTMISDLIATVERAEQKARELAMEQELHTIFAMQIPVTERHQMFMGAA
jgi:hypothetical protein